LPWLFAFTLLVSATLLFLLQPMIGKMMLPKLGGTPAVWATCMVFFQAALLAGYAYCHFAPLRLGAQRQKRLHVLLLLSPFVLLPLSWAAWSFARMPIGVATDWAPPGEMYPLLPALHILTLTVGLPFFVVATAAPLLQRWYASLNRPSARDPYFLYSASNLGSMAALLGYPILVEPWIGLTAQGWLWLVGYGIFVGMTLTCLLLVERSLAALPEPLLAADAPAPVANTAVQTEAGLPDTTAVTARKPASPAWDAELAAEPSSREPTHWDRFLWVARAFVPSSLMLAVTTYITTDLAPIPLLWVVPLAIYLLTFIIAFARLPAIIHTMFVVLTPFMVLLSAFLLNADLPMSHNMKGVLHLFSLFVVAQACHGQLAQDRPAARHLTEFYLWIALGGVLGGIFNALVAPLIFTRLAEYPLALVLAYLLLPPVERRSPGRWVALADALWLVLLVLIGGILSLFALSDGGSWADWFGQLPMEDVFWTGLFIFGCLLGAALTGWFSGEARLDRLVDFLMPLAIGLVTTVFLGLSNERSRTFSLGLVVLILNMLALVVVGALHWVNRQPQRLLNFLCPAVLGWLVGFGMLRSWLATRTESSNLAEPTELLRVVTVAGLPLLLAALWTDRPLRFGLTLGAVLLAATLVEDVKDAKHVLLRERSFFSVLKVKEVGEYNELLHGTTLHGMQNRDQPAQPVSYYYHSSPIADVMREQERRGAPTPLAVLGLGVGTMAVYGRPGQEVTFYEIDPTMVRIARNRNLFTFLSDAERSGVNLKIVLGDGRLQIARAPDGQYGLILADAFSSDAIPMHLLTREALQTYVQKLAPGGLVAFHISNRYLDLGPMLGNLAADAKLFAVERTDNHAGLGQNNSHWVVMARQRADLGGLATDTEWIEVPSTPDGVRWTDDFSNLWRVYRWK
jgi:spermidine synthase